MDEAREVLDQAARWGDAGLGVALATVVSAWGSAPRRAGSQLAVNERGAFAGSVSGGCVEAEVITAAIDALRDGRPRLLEFGVPQERAWAVGLPCGGRIQVAVTPVTWRGVLDALRQELAARRAAVLALDLAGGGASLPGADDPAAREALRADAPARVDRDGRDLLLVPFVPRPRLLLVGAVHVAQALAPMAGLAGYEVVVIDPRPAFATVERFQGAPLDHAWPGEALGRLGLDRRTAVVSLAHDPKLDLPSLEAALRSEAFYVGCLGSRRTQAALRERLRAAGVEEAALGRIHGPVGLPIGAASPAEIAVSILAEVVACARGAAVVAGPTGRLHPSS